jgi:hypothetical protein
MAAILFGACKKEMGQNSSGSDGKSFKLAFSSSSIDLNDIDSAIIMLTKPGSAVITKKLIKQNGYMTAATTGIPAGNWKIEWVVYAESPVSNDEYGRQYVYNQTEAFPLSAAIEQQAPKGDFDGTWLPRVWMKDAETGLTIVMGMDFADPFLSMKAAPGKEYSYYYIDKIASWVDGNTNNMVGADNLEVTGDFPSPYLEDLTSFADLAEMMKTRNWNKGEILVLIEEKNGPESIFYYVYQK